MFSTSETLYVLPSYSISGAGGMRLASTSAYSTGMYVGSGGSVTYYNSSDKFLGFRPIVCLNSGVSITDNGDGSVTLK